MADRLKLLLTSARDLARFGNMVLNKRTLAGHQILRTESITELLTPSQELNRAYGMLWVVERPATHSPTFRRRPY
ncbi:MAG: hypothetical protein CM15mP49_13610 [Actinomycetota bacterium]|nr:MAG: hypothetical protein CM15mP49_13610 [Actinomycetota bacterium]